jgi:hypothetical protein
MPERDAEPKPTNCQHINKPGSYAASHSSSQSHSHSSSPTPPRSSPKCTLLFFCTFAFNCPRPLCYPTPPHPPHPTFESFDFHHTSSSQFNRPAIRDRTATNTTNPQDETCKYTRFSQPNESSGQPYPLSAACLLIISASRSNWRHATALHCT